MKNGWTIDGNLTTLQIVCLTLFVVFVLSLMLLNTWFLIYRFQLKKIKKIEQNLEILSRYPLDNAINRLERINRQNNNLFDDFYRLIRIKYLTVFQETFNSAGIYFKNGLEKKEFTKFSYKAIVKLLMIDRSVDKAKTEFDTLLKLVNDFFDYEFQLRDMMIELKEEVDLIKSNYKRIKKNQKIYFDEEVFKDYLNYIFNYINLIHERMVVGDYATSADKFLKLVSWTKKVNQEIVTYSKIKNYFQLNLSQELNEIERDWTSESFGSKRAKTRFKFLKERSLNEAKIGLMAIDSLDFKRSKEAIDYIKKEIYEFKSELVYEQEIKSFFKFKGQELNNTTQVIIDWIGQLKNEASEQFLTNQKEIYETLIKPCLRIQDNLTKLTNINERELENVKKQFDQDLLKINQNLYLLNIIKTTNSLNEKDFFNYLNISFEIKTNLITINNVLMAPNWLNEKQLTDFTNDYNQLYHQLVKEELPTIDQFTSKYSEVEQKNGLFNRLNNIKTYSYKLKSTLIYDYQLYYLANALLPLLEFGQNEGKIHYIYQLMIKEIDEHNYEQAINHFVNNLNSIYYEL